MMQMLPALDPLVVADAFDVPLSVLGSLEPIEIAQTFLNADVSTARFMAEFMDMALYQVVVIEGFGIFRYLGYESSESGYTVKFIYHD